MRGLLRWLVCVFDSLAGYYTKVSIILIIFMATAAVKYQMNVAYRHIDQTQPAYAGLAVRPRSC